MLFADNFDYQDLRQDFIRGVLTDDILANKIFAHVITGEYAARVRDLRTYNSVRYFLNFNASSNNPLAKISSTDGLILWFLIVIY